MLHEKLKKLMAGKKDMSPHEKAAKMDVVGQMRDMAMGHMQDKMGAHAKHQVSVASDSPEGLKAGLDQAKQVVAQSSSGGDSDSPPGMSDGGQVVSDEEEAEMLKEAENPEGDALTAHQEHEDEQGHEDAESPEAHAAEHDPDDDMDEDELNAKLEKLMKMKASKSKKSSNPY